VLVGYSDNEARVFCAKCWPAHAEAGSRPAEVLESTDPLDPANNFWIVCVCVECGGHVKYLNAVAMN
jgi:hypothetical protein